MRAATIVGVLVAMLEAAPGLPGQQLDAGPLLAFTEVIQDAGQRKDVLRVVELEGKGNFELLRGGSRARVLHRLDRNHLLLGRPNPERLVTVDVPNGVERELTRGDVQFAGVHGDDVLYLEDPGKKGLLHKVSWREEAPPTRLVEHGFQRVPLIAGNIAFAVDLLENSVWIVSLASGRSREVWTAPEGHSRVRIALSPSGQRLAVGAIDTRHNGRLEVVDVATGESIQMWDGLPIGLSPMSSGGPTLEVGFADDDNVICSETRTNPRDFWGCFVHVTRSLATGDIEDEAVYANLGMQHVPPRPPPPDPLFEITRSQAYAVLQRVEDSDALASIRRSEQKYEDLAVSRPGGRYATARLGDQRKQLTLFSRAVEPRQISKGWAYGLTWLPAAR